MREEWTNRKVEVIDAPEKSSHLIGQTGYICPNVGTQPDEVIVKLSDGVMGLFCIDQLRFVEE